MSLFNILIGFVTVGEGLVTILSLGSYTPNWRIAFVFWYLTRKKEEHN